LGTPEINRQWRDIWRNAGFRDMNNRSLLINNLIINNGARVRAEESEYAWFA